MKETRINLKGVKQIARGLADKMEELNQTAINNGVSNNYTDGVLFGYKQALEDIISNINSNIELLK